MRLPIMKRRSLTDILIGNNIERKEGLICQNKKGND